MIRVEPLFRERRTSLRTALGAALAAGVLLVAVVALSLGVSMAVLDAHDAHAKPGLLTCSSIEPRVTR